MSVFQRTAAQLSCLLVAVVLLVLPAVGSEVSTWSATAASNNTAPPNGWPAGMFPNQVEPTAREMMAAIRRWFNTVRLFNTGTVETGSMTLYVTSTGLDTANCRAASVSGDDGPCLTVQHAVNVYMESYDLHTSAAFISVGCGSFAGLTAGGVPVGQAQGSAQGAYIVLLGTQSASTNCTTITGNIFGDAVTVTAGMRLAVGTANLVVSTAARGAIFVDLAGFATIWDSNVYLLSTNATAHLLHVEQKGTFFLPGAYTLHIDTGNVGGSIVAAGYEGYVDFDPGSTVKCEGTGAFTNNFSLQDHGLLAAGSTTFATCGSITGQRFYIDGGSEANVGTNSLTFLPGSTAGQLCSGGVYKGTKAYVARGGGCITPSDNMVNEDLLAVTVASFDATSNTTYANVTSLSLALSAAKTYVCRAVLSLTSGASGGVKVRLKDSGGLTVTGVWQDARGYNGNTVQGAGSSTSFSADLLNTAAVYTDAVIEWTIIVNAAGTLSLQMAQQTSNGTTSSVLPLSSMRCVSTQY